MRALLALALLLMPMAAQAEASEPAGHYYLEGVRETGSELLLEADGHYQWYLTYGALDQYSAGRWQKMGATIVLTANAKDLAAAVPNAVSPFTTMTLRIDRDDLVPEQGPGRYARH